MTPLGRAVRRVADTEPSRTIAGMPAAPDRTIVSYVRRSARMTASQIKAMQHWGSTYLLDLETGERQTALSERASVDWDKEFGKLKGPLTVELGSGSGDALVARALAATDARHIAFEVFEKSVAATMIKLVQAGVSNVRIGMVDGVAALRQLFDSGSIQDFYVLFPDPWHKTRHHKRRMVNDRFAELLADRLAIGGTASFATDWEEYAHQIRAVMDAHLDNLHPDSWAPRDEERPVTRYEARGIRAGRTVYDLKYRRSR